MQQTETLKLNIIEGTDTVDPAPINENMETLEAETTAIRAKMATETTAIRTEMATETSAIREEVETVREEAATEATAIRTEVATGNTALWEKLTDMAENLGSGGKNCRIAYGTYPGTGTSGASAPQVFNVDFKPMLFYLTTQYGNQDCHILRPAAHISGGEYSDTLEVTWGEKSVSFYSTDTYSASTYQFNIKGITYCYLILGVDE